MLKIRVLPLGNVAHVQSTIAGFSILSREGCFEASFHNHGPRKYSISSKSDWDAVRHIVLAEVDGIGLVVFDTHDSQTINEQLRSIATVYFKRSFSEVDHNLFGNVFPLGLNYLCYDDVPTLSGISRALSFGNGPKIRLKNCFKEIFGDGRVRHTASKLANVELRRKPGGILFVVRLWDPFGFSEIPQHEIAHREHMNDLRIKCVRAIRNEFGPKFNGGLIRTNLSEKLCPDLIVDHETSTKRSSFLKKIEQCDICVSTRGLLDSVGWSFAEYVAKGRAIVTENMRYTLPGPFSPDHNYLEFSSPDECCNKISFLLENSNARHEMMDANRHYFQSFGTPTAIVKNALTVAVRFASESNAC